LMIPVEEHPGGIMHRPVIIVADLVDEVHGTYDCAVAALGGAPFYGSGIAFEVTLKVKCQPVDPDPDVNFMVEFTLEDLAPPACGPIPHFTENCNVTIHSYPNWNIADVNGDLKVDIVDVLLCANAYQATPLDPNWDLRCDIAEPYDIIDIFDIVMICSSYGEEYHS